MYNPEKDRVTKRTSGDWKKWGPYVTERQWGTVREDYSTDGAAWEYFSHDDARSRAYRWGEDGIHGICDRKQYLCFGLSMWNEKDSIIKERLFGLTGNQGTHGEDVKELYYYLDSTPTHSYMKELYKYPQSEFPYAKIVEENAKRTKSDPTYNLLDTGVFDEDRYFDIITEYAKDEPEDIYIRITVVNRGPETAKLHLMPTIWFRNYWAYYPGYPKPEITVEKDGILNAWHPEAGNMYLYYEGKKKPGLLFCNNETNHEKVYGHKATKGFWKDGINNFVVNKKKSAINPKLEGTKASIRFSLTLEPGETKVIKMRLADKMDDIKLEKHDYVFLQRISQADLFYDEIAKKVTDTELKNIQRQAFAGLMMTKQFYYFDVEKWLKGDGNSAPPASRMHGRNHEWMHLNNMEIISMPDKWEYPWYAAWDLAFHCIPIALIDPDFAKRQLILLLREWYMHPNGQIPAYEWHFSDVNPPVHAWACWRVYEIERDNYGVSDTNFLERVFQKLMLNFTWWVNRKDSSGNNIFEGGFLGLDNIGVFDRSRPLPTGGTLEQADGTSWMAMYSLNMLRISMELSKTNAAYEDISSKFLEHFLHIASAMSNVDGDKDSLNLWNEEDGFFYDVLNTHDGNYTPLKIRSMVGLIPLFAIETLEPELTKKLPHFNRRLEWFFNFKPEYFRLISTWNNPKSGVRRRFSILKGSRLKRVLSRLLDENEFLSDFGIRALSKYHKENPYTFTTNTEVLSVEYNPGESDSGMFGGNSNWRGPIWFPVNYLLVESLRKFHGYYGDDVQVEYPTGSGVNMNLKQVADKISDRLISIFTKDKDGRRPVFGDKEKLQNDPNFQDHILFYEYFHGDTGAGLGASHQTGWTALVADLIHSKYN
jgi:hypothetical protein